MSARPLIHNNTNGSAEMADLKYKSEIKKDPIDGYWTQSKGPID